MAFTREDIASYEKQTPVPVDDKTFFESPTGAVQTPETPKEETKVEASPSTEETPASETADSDGSKVETKAEATTATAEPEGETQPEADEGSKPKRGSAQERIEELVAERNSLRQYGEYLLEQMKQRAQANEAKPAVKAAIENDPPPTLEQHQFDPVAHAKALNEWIDRQVDKRVEQAVRTTVVQREEQTLRSNFEARTAEFRKTNPDFDVVLANPALPSLDKLAARQVVKMDNGPAIAYHLAKNPDLATRIARMEPEQQLLAIGRIDAQLTTPPPKPQVVTPKRTVTQAPPPPKPVSSSTTVSEKPEDLMSMEEWVNKDRARKIAEKEAKRRMREAMR